MSRKSTPYTSFGMDVYSTSNYWSDIIRGPTSAQVRHHLAKLANFLEPLR